MTKIRKIKTFLSFHCSLNCFADTTITSKSIPAFVNRPSILRFTIFEWFSYDSRKRSRSIGMLVAVENTATCISCLTWSMSLSMSSTRKIFYLVFLCQTFTFDLFLFLILWIFQHLSHSDFDSFMRWLDRPLLRSANKTSFYVRTAYIMYSMNWDIAICLNRRFV